ncbi:hypothetical protein WDW89_08105 [Deltaproteobacteria bacterium TL4]
MRVTHLATNLVHAFCQLAYNWEPKDITMMFSQSRLGIKYWEARFQEEGASLLSLYMAADVEHKFMMVDYLVNQKYPTMFKKPKAPQNNVKVIKKVGRRENPNLKLVIDNTREHSQSFSRP